MEQQLNFYQAQYQPSFISDQAKIDEFGIESLNTPDINPEFFTDSPNLFGKASQSNSQSQSLLSHQSGLSQGKAASIKVDQDDYSLIFPDSLGLGSTAGVTSAFDRTATYSPFPEDTKQTFDSAPININSPEMMMPVSPNKVCPQLGYEDLVALDQHQQHQQQPTFNQMNDYETLQDFDYYQHSSTSSRSSSISAGSADNYDNYLLADNHSHLMTSSVDPHIHRVPQSPAGSTHSSSYDSSPKSFVQLETVQIKQEPVDLYQPTVVAEFANYQVDNYSTINASDLSGYYYTTAASSNVMQPSTVPAAIMAPQIMQQQTLASAAPVTTPSSHSGPSRKRNAGAAFSSSSSSSSHSSHSHSASAPSSGSKKPRMTKREKQKLMEGDISKYENENRDLRQSIDLLERQIAFCKRFLSENVAPVIQRQQAQQLHHFGNGNMVITVEGQ